LIVYVGYPGHFTLPDGEKKEDFLLGVAIHRDELEKILKDSNFSKTDLGKEIQAAASVG